MNVRIKTWIEDRDKIQSQPSRAETIFEIVGGLVACAMTIGMMWLFLVMAGS